MFILFYNPISRSGDGEKSLQEVTEYIDTAEYKAVNVLDVQNWDTLGEAYANDDVFVVIGGDGTLSKFINLANGVPQKVLFYAGGTGNDFLRNFPETLVEYNGNVDKPVCKSNETKKVLNSFGTGIDTQVLSLYNKAKKHNNVTYMLSTLRSFLTYKPTTVTVDIDGETTVFEKAYLVAVQNGKYFGGGMMVAPKSEPGSGVLDIIVVHSISRFNLFRIFPKIYKGGHTAYDNYVYYAQGKEVKITREKPHLYSTDGEMGESSSTEFTINL